MSYHQIGDSILDTVYDLVDRPVGAQLGRLELVSVFERIYVYSAIQRFLSSNTQFSSPIICSLDHVTFESRVRTSRVPITARSRPQLQRRITLALICQSTTITDPTGKCIESKTPALAKRAFSMEILSERT